MPCHCEPPPRHFGGAAISSSKKQRRLNIHLTPDGNRRVYLGEIWGYPMPTEADTCRTYIVPNLHTSGWDDDHITEQMVLTRGRIVPIGDRHIRKEGLRPECDGLVVSTEFPVCELNQKKTLPETGGGIGCVVTECLDKAFKGEL